MLQTFLHEFVKTDWVNEKGTVNSIDQVRGNTRIREGHAVNAVPGDGVFVLRFEDHAGDVEMLSVLERFIDPGFQHFRAHLHLFVDRLEPGVFGLDDV